MVSMMRSGVVPLTFSRLGSDFASRDQVIDWDKRDIQTYRYTIV